MMTVRGLIEALSALDPGTLILVRDQPVIVYGQIVNDTAFGDPKLCMMQDIRFDDNDEPFIAGEFLAIKSENDK